MNPLDPSYISRSEFRKALNVRCYKELGVGLNDLPDINIDDNWWEKMTEKEAVIMIESCIEELKEA
jgi:hypothetical protein